MQLLIIGNEGLIPEKFRSSFKKLAEKLHDLVSVHICQCFSGGYSESSPLLVYATYKNSKNYQVFKIGENQIIKEEVRGWNEFIKNGPYEHLHVTHLKEHISDSPHSLIVYNYAGRIDKEPITFETLYKSNKNPENILKYFKDIIPISAKRLNNIKRACDPFCVKIKRNILVYYFIRTDSFHMVIMQHEN